MQHRPILHNIAFTLSAGDGLGVIGPSASGKSTLARALAGAWRPMRGTIRLDGAALDQWDREALGRDIGYLPQDIELFDGTIAENIARLEPNASSDAVIAAARAAGRARDDPRPAGRLRHAASAKAARRFPADSASASRLARALYGDPFFVVLDEPNSNLDAEGDAALTARHRRRARAGRHRRRRSRTARPRSRRSTSSLCSANGQLQAFGPKEEVLAKVIQPVGWADPAAFRRPGMPKRSAERRPDAAGHKV